MKRKKKKKNAGADLPRKSEIKIGHIFFRRNLKKKGKKKEKKKRFFKQLWKDKEDLFHERIKRSLKEGRKNKTKNNI